MTEHVEVFVTNVIREAIPALRGEDEQILVFGMNHVSACNTELIVAEIGSNVYYFHRESNNWLVETDPPIMVYVDNEVLLRQCVPILECRLVAISRDRVPDAVFDAMMSTSEVEG